MRMEIGNLDSSRPLASLSLDLDNQWSYMKTHGDQGWEKFPSYFDIVLPGLLDVLDEQKLKITFFLVGQDAALEKNREALETITARGHEVGNHSFHHEVWLHTQSKAQIEKEILEAEGYIVRVTGDKPVGFRGPGFSWNEAVIEVLVDHGYLYDATTLPMYLGPLARLYYFWNSKLNSEEKEQRSNLYGSFKDGLRPVKPYFWEMSAEARLLEIPVTTIPIIKVPFHLSYLLYLSRYSGALMRQYLRLAVGFCRMAGVGPSFLLHPLDFISGDQVPELKFFPGMDLDRDHKFKVFRDVITYLGRHFKLSPMSVHASALTKRGKLKTLRLRNHRG